MGLFGGDNKGTFKPKKKDEKGSKRYELHKKAKATLGTGDLHAAVQCPKGEDVNDWIAANTVDFFNTINLLYGSVMEFCTPTECPIMSAGPKYEYLWADGVKIKDPIQCSANEYIDHLMTWIEGLLNDEKTFPSNTETPFPKKFLSIVKKIYTRLFRVYAHIYYSHFAKIQALGEEAHLNTSFKHFCLFAMQFQLIEKKEMVPLDDILNNLLTTEYANYK